MNLVCEKDMCTGCMACMNICPKNAISIHDSYLSYNAIIDEGKCVNCNLCHGVCQNNNEIELMNPKLWYQGWISDEKLREQSSSGGAATALALKFIKEEGLVCSCIFDKGQFVFQTASRIEDISKFRGSKYVKSNPGNIYKVVSESLLDKKKVLFIGLPCQAAALRIYVAGISKEAVNRLYTVDLICHGTPSPRLLEKYLRKKGIDIKKTDNIQFRSAMDFNVKCGGKYMAYPGTLDEYTLAFLRGIDYTYNCYSCRYAGIKRGSDLTIGDSWGSELSEEEKEKGISLILCQTDNGKELLRDINMQLQSVDLDKAIAANGQLRAPYKKTKFYNIFWKKYKGNNLAWATFCCYPVKCIKQKIKALYLKYNGK